MMHSIQDLFLLSIQASITLFLLILSATAPYSEISVVQGLRSAGLNL